MEVVDDRPLNVRTEYQQLPVDIIRKKQKYLSKNVSVLLFNIRTDGNVGMIIRQACILGCKQVIICGRKSYDRRFTVGSHNYIDVVHYDTPLHVRVDMVSPGVFKETINYDAEEFVRLLAGYTPIFLEQGGMDIQQVYWKTIENPLLILGNESIGIPNDFIKIVKSKVACLFISIPQYSVMRSMNVAMAASIALWEITKNI